VNYVVQLLRSKLLYDFDSSISSSCSSSHPSPASVPPKRLSSIEVRPEVVRKYSQRLEEDFTKTVWVQNRCRKQGGEEGEGEDSTSSSEILSKTHITNWAGTGIGYWTSTMKPRLEDFEIRDEKGTGSRRPCLVQPTSLSLPPLPLFCSLCDSYGYSSLPAVIPTNEVERPLTSRKGAEKMLSFLKWFELNHSPLGEGCFYSPTTSPSLTTSLLPFFRFAE
jgi:hypothetical protein